MTEIEFRQNISGVYEYAKIHNIPLVFCVFYPNESEPVPYFTGDIIDRIMVMDSIQEAHSINTENEIVRLKEENRILIEEIQ